MRRGRSRVGKDELLKLGEFLRRLRTKHGYLLEKVAKETGYSIIHISEVERGLKKPSDELISALAKVYRIPEEKLFLLAGRIPPSFTQEVIENKELQALIIEIMNIRELPEEVKREKYKAVTEFVKKISVNDYVKAAR